MTQETSYFEPSSFSLLMTNIFIGLVCRNHPYFRAYSEGVRSLKYRLHSVETKFQSSNGTVNPEAIACSKIQKHSLFAEWTTQNRLDDRKINQISKYLEVSATELVEQAKIDSTSSNSHSVWLVVLPSHIQSFKSLITKDNEERLLICSLSTSSGSKYKLCFHGGSLQDKALSESLRQTMDFSRIPSYLPFPLDDVRNSEIFSDGVITEVISRAVRGEDSFEVLDICEAMYPIWKYISPEKQKNIRKVTRKILNKLCAKKYYCGGWLERSDLYWKIKTPSTSTIQRLRSTLQDKPFSLD